MSIPSFRSRPVRAAATTSLGKDVLAVEDLRVEFSTVGGVIRAVDKISFSLRRGEVLGVIGESGSGKSVLAESILGLSRETASFVGGRIQFRELELQTLDQKQLRQLRGKDIGLVFQDSNATLNPTLTIGYQLAEVFRTRLGVNRRDARERSVDVLRRVGFPAAESRIDDYPYQLSGGMRQRVMIALAIALEPTLLIADEATTALDVTVQAEIIELLKKLCADLAMAMIFISHDLAVASEIADRIAVMYAGKIVEIGAAATVLESPRHPYTRALLDSSPSVDQGQTEFKSIVGNPPDPIERPTGCAFHPRCRFSDERCQHELPRLEFVAPTHSAACHRKSELELGDTSPDGAGLTPRRVKRPTDRAPLLVADGLWREFETSGRGGSRNLIAVKEATFEVFPQETLAIVGESGSGKSTVARMVGRLLAPTKGTVCFDNTDIWQLGGRALRDLRLRVQTVFQDPLGSLDPRMNVGDIIREPWIVNRLSMSRKEQERQLHFLLEDVGLRIDDARRRPREFSGGQRQRIAVARALALKPALVICDEPVSALDVSAQAELLNLFRRLQTEHRISYLFISHDLAVVRHVADRVAVMQEGCIVEMGEVRDVYAAPAHPYTRRLLAAVPGKDGGRRVGSRIRALSEDARLKPLDSPFVGEDSSS